MGFFIDLMNQFLSMLEITLCADSSQFVNFSCTARNFMGCRKFVMRIVFCRVETWSDFDPHAGYL